MDNLRFFLMVTACILAITPLFGQLYPDEVVFTWPIESNPQDTYWLSHALLAENPVYSSNILKMMACEEYVLPYILENSDPVQAIKIAHEVLSMRNPSSAIRSRGLNPDRLFLFKECPSRISINIKVADVEHIVRSSFKHYPVHSIAETVFALGPEEAVKFIKRQYSVNTETAKATYQRNFVEKEDTRELQCTVDHDQKDIFCNNGHVYSTSNLARLMFHGYMLS